MIDNDGAISIANNPTHHSKSRHIQIRDMFIRDVTKKGDVRPTHVHTDENCADHFTKVLPWAAFSKHRRTLMGESI
jgi:hypothetical protein